jgi:hypothetical protein
LIQEILNFVKVDKEELEELKGKFDQMQEQEINQGLNDLFGPPQNSMTEDEAKSLI